MLQAGLTPLNDMGVEGCTIHAPDGSIMEDIYLPGFHRQYTTTETSGEYTQILHAWISEL
jgi:hypothetical protein